MNDETPEKAEIFRHLLLAGDLLAHHASDEQGRTIRDLLKQSGIILNQSDFQVLDRCTIGTSRIMIVRYMLDYMISEDAAGKRIRVEGTVASERDYQGNTHIRILSRPLSSYPASGIVQSGSLTVKSNP
ncbi:MAG: hypothetical protein ABFC78_09600 [Methanoregula sp.]